MLSILNKVNSKVICIINTEKFMFESGKTAYDSFKDNYLIESISISNDSIVFVLTQIIETNEWKKNYQEQFGKEPSFF